MVDTAKIVLADSFKFYVRAQGYHWNVEGPLFLQYHELFEKIYSDVHGSIDIIAEEIRAMGVYVPGSLGRFLELSSTGEEREIVDPQTMISRLLDENNAVLNSIKNAYDAAEAASNHGFSNLMAERMSAHKKIGWMLKASSS